MVVLLYLRNAPRSLSESPSMVLSMFETHSSASMSPLGPPMSVLTQPGCMHITRMPFSFSSTERFFMAMFRATLLHLLGKLEMEKDKLPKK